MGDGIEAVDTGTEEDCIGDGMGSVDTVTDNCVGDLSVKLESVRAPFYEQHCIDTGDDLASAECLEDRQRPTAVQIRPDLASRIRL